ncbi:hypothetical protein Cni_G09943 [Canna indica]|uniref:Cyclin-like domain-containing protein n=1 Tax=Canna indica TaxID=4628 RepID=A0AAQ3Q855_9LILI|nr:hypothetical protein Cni_G09943 [Canna indica]
MGEPSRASFDLGMISPDPSTEDTLRHRYRSSWYFSKEEIEKNSPSRKDGIDMRKESQIRMLYCSLIREIGLRLGIPQITIATAIMFCHRFYLHQSHAKNEWQTIATVCIFLASKVEDTPCGLDKVVLVAYETMYKRDPDAAKRIRQKYVFEKQKALILIGDRLLLSTIRFDFNVQHPYKPLVAALKKLGITKEVGRAAWNYVNDWLWSTLCLQYKAHYIAAGSLFLAAKLHNANLPSERGHVWWHEFDVSPQQLEVVIQQMKQHLEFNRRSSVTPFEKPVQVPITAKKEVSSSPDSVLNRSQISGSSSSQEYDADLNCHKPMDSTENVRVTIFNAETEQSSGYRTESQCQMMSSEIPISISEHKDILERNVDQARAKRDQGRVCLGKVDMDRIKATIKKRKREREMNGLLVTANDSSEDAWIERELEAGIVLEADSAVKRQMFRSCH